MSIRYSEKSLLETIRAGLLKGPDAHVVAFPSISLKAASPKEASPADIYEILPHGNYYQHYSRSNKMAKPGTFTVHADTAGTGLPSIINFYCRIYPGTKVYPNDNPSLRERWYTEIVGALTTTRGIKSLHLEFPEGMGNVQVLDDFIKTYALNGGGQLDIHIYGGEPRTPPTSLSLGGGLSARADTVPILEFSDEQLVNEILYEVDIVRYTIWKPAAPEPPSSLHSLPPLLTYFPPGWQFFTDDDQIRELAVQVYSGLAPVWDSAELYPPRQDIFNAFTYLQGVAPRVVILGQDPYHGPGQAHGLSFSVNMGVAIPPSLRNIYKALENDADIVPRFVAPRHGNLLKWAEQGVVMLNSSLTVLRGQANCHQRIWERFTDRLIWLLASKYQNLVFVLWGTSAKAKRTLISSNGHLILEYNHPSPMVKNNDFATGCKHFSQINRFLQEKGFSSISWTL
jgi:uracil-DNA glycosylase